MSDHHSAQHNALSIYRRLLKFVAHHWAIFSLGILATILGAGLESSLALLPKPLIDEVLTHKNPLMVQWAPYVVVAIFFLRNLMSLASTYCISRVGRKVVLEFRQQIFQHLMRLPANFFDGNSSGRLLSTLIYNVEQLASASTEALMTSVREGFKVMGLLLVMFTISWKLSLIFLTTAPFIALILRYSSRRLRKQNTGVQTAMGDLSHVAEESIEGYRVIRTFGGTMHETNKFFEATQANFQREMKVVMTGGLSSTMVQVIASVPIAMILYWATSPSMSVTPGEFASILGSMLLLLPAMRRLTRVNPSIQRGIASAQGVFDLLAEKPEMDTGTAHIGRAKGKITFERVSFRYPTAKRWALKDLNFTVNPGETIALVGHSGAGKSTFVSLLPRFYELTEGHIFIDNKDIGEYQLTDLRQQFGLVSQRITLFSDTVANNIAYGNLKHATESDLWRVAELAHATEFIQELPKGMDTMIGENGVLLSGGQRQRIAIARALMKNAPILILDEATSSLDTESERYIQAALDSLMQDKTTIVIAHRLSTIENADRIIVLHRGQIIEMGSHHELLSKKSHYAKLHAMQFRKAKEKAVVE